MTQYGYSQFNEDPEKLDGTNNAVSLINKHKLKVKNRWNL